LLTDYKSGLGSSDSSATVEYYGQVAATSTNENWATSQCFHIVTAVSSSANHYVPVSITAVSLVPVAYIYYAVLSAGTMSGPGSYNVEAVFKIWGSYKYTGVYSLASQTLV
jgi:hypothetical protein